tara:strand:+ start:5382 stop:6035 length:654 start_codon:yes stop_codon:yes gene_type:complete
VSSSPAVIKLGLKIRYLKAELDECQQIYDSGKIQFFNSAIERKDQMGAKDDEISNESLSDNGDISPIDESPSQPEHDHTIDDFDHTDDSVIEKPSWVKKIFREIALMTHPDKMPPSLNKILQEKLVKIYKKAAESYKSNNYINLIESASDLGIDISVDDDEFTSFLKGEIVTLERKISDIKVSAIWQWIHADDTGRSDIMNMFVKIRGWSDTQNEES